MALICEEKYRKDLSELLLAFSLNPDLDFNLSITSLSSYYVIKITCDNILYKYVFLKPLTDKNFKLIIRQKSYQVLRAYTGIELPYGILLGIRPVKLFRSLVRKSPSTDSALFIMTELYYLKPEMAERLLSVYRAEEVYMRGSELNKKSLYMGIAFCPSRCYYCSFTSNDINKKSSMVSPYVYALINELKLKLTYREREDEFYRDKIDVLYIGGGTPSSIPLAELEILLSALDKELDLASLREFTFEAGRVDTMSDELFALLKKYHVSRLSINPQSMKDSTLKMLGRRHEADDVAAAFQKARAHGFSHINSDLILGLKGEDDEDMIESLNKLILLDPESITLHSLAIKRDSDYGLGYKLKNEIYTVNKAYADLQNKLIAMLKSANYHPYYLYRQKLIAGGLDNIGFSKRGFESVYNIRIMEEEHEILGLGAASTSKFFENGRLINKRNPKDLESYILKYKNSDYHSHISYS